MDQARTDAGRPEKFPLDVDPIAEVMTPVMGAATTFNRNLLASVTTYQKEWATFANQRWHENLELPLRLGNCRTLLEFEQVYLGYLKRAAEQYGVEFRHLGLFAQSKAQPVPQSAETPAKPKGATVQSAQDQQALH